MAPQKRVVVDTSVIVAALFSPSGGSAKVIDACRNGTLQCAVSISTKDEIYRNAERLRAALVQDFDALADCLPAVNPSAVLVDEFTDMTDPDDAHLLAACEEWGADYLVSLNRKHLLENKRAQSAIQARIVNPGELITLIGL